MDSYRLTLNQQSNGDYEVHEDGCRYFPTQNYDYLGHFSNCGPAVATAKQKHPYKNINGCFYCSKPCLQPNFLSV